MLPLQFQKVDLVIQSGLPVKAGGIQNPPNLLQRELKLSKQQNALEPFQGRIVIQPVACLRHPGGLQQTDGIIVVQRAHTDTGHLTHLFYCFHVHPSVMLE